MSDSAETRVELSLNQEFLQMFDQGDDAGPFGPSYNILYAVRISGGINTAVLQHALDSVVERHEALRTLIVRGQHGYQLVQPPAPVALEVRELGADGDRDRKADQLLVEVEAGQYGSSTVPLLRAFLGRFDDADSVLALVAHHTVADEWSMPVIMRDLAAFYSGTALPEVKQFRDYTTWERTRPEAAMEKARAYWRGKLGDAQVVAVPTQFGRSEGRPKTTAWQRFTIPADLVAGTQAIAKQTRSSPFQVLLAAYNVLVRKQSGTDDVVVMSFTSGRTQAQFHETVGAFFNFVPLRVDLSGLDGATDFAEVVKRTRRACLEALAHDIPFSQVMAEASPMLMAPGAAENGALCAFQVFRSLIGGAGTIGDASYTVIQRRELAQGAGGDIPDGAMWHLDMDLDATGADMTGRLGYNTNLFDEAAMTELIGQFLQILKETVGAS